MRSQLVKNADREYRISSTIAEDTLRKTTTTATWVARDLTSSTLRGKGDFLAPGAKATGGIEGAGQG